MATENLGGMGNAVAPASKTSSLMLQWIVCFFKVLWLCGFAIATLVLGAICFIWVDQGKDLLRMLVEPTPSMAGVSPGIALFVSAIAWSLASWYTSRLLLIRRLPGFPLPTTESGGLREWMPRVLGAASPLIMAIAFGLVATSADTEPALEAAWASSILYGALTVTLFIFYWKRRIWFPDATGRIGARAHLTNLSRVARNIVALSIIASFVILIIFVFAPVAPARALGTAAIFVSAATSILLFGSVVLEYAPLAAGYPGLLLVVLIWGVVWSPFNDNHPIRTAADPTMQGFPMRDDPATHFQKWLEHARPPASATTTGASRPYPVFIVTAAGGGIRAAYWTAALLGAAAQQVGKDNGGDIQPWRRHLYALSGVSGGSLGAAVHVVELSQGEPADSYVSRAKAMLGADHLSPVAAFMLYSDLAQRFLPPPLVFPALDRARALESSWERSAHDMLDSDAFSASLLSLWNRNPYELPALLLNSTRVETGQRVIVSNLAIPTAVHANHLDEDPPEFLDAVDLIGMTAPATAPSGSSPPDTIAPLRRLDGIRLSSAVHLSARFTYVSPAARVERTDGSLWGRLVDGGYFENSGAATAADLIRTICPDWDDETPSGQRVCNADVAELHNVVPVVLLIKNEPHAASLCDPYLGPNTVGRTPLTELKPPIDALLNTREARGRLAERSIVRLVEGQDIPAGSCDAGCVLELSLAPPALQSAPASSAIASRGAEKRNPYNDPPLGWSLSDSSRRAMDARLGDADIQGQLQCLSDLAGGKQCNTARRCGR